MNTSSSVAEIRLLWEAVEKAQRDYFLIKNAERPFRAEQRKALRKALSAWGRALDTYMKAVKTGGPPPAQPTPGPAPRRPTLGGG